MDSELNPPLFLNQIQIDEVFSHKYLGVVFSANLRWKEHIDEIAIKARKRLNLMLPLKMKVDRKSIEIMYVSFVLPCMEYASVVWGGLPDCDISRLEKIHTDALRLISGASARSNTINVFIECDAITLHERMEQASLIMLFKIIKGKAPQYLIEIHDDIQNKANYSYSLRNATKLRTPYCRLESFKNSFFPRVLHSWNKLSRDTRLLDTVDRFKTSLNKPHNLEKYNFKQILYYYGKRWASVHHARMRIAS